MALLVRLRCARRVDRSLPRHDHSFAHRSCLVARTSSVLPDDRSLDKTVPAASQSGQPASRLSDVRFDVAGGLSCVASLLAWERRSGGRIPAVCIYIFSRTTGFSMRSPLRSELRRNVRAPQPGRPVPVIRRGYLGVLMSLWNPTSDAGGRSASLPGAACWPAGSTTLSSEGMC